jgi:hypothetical protein
MLSKLLFPFYSLEQCDHLRIVGHVAGHGNAMAAGSGNGGGGDNSNDIGFTQADISMAWLCMGAVCRVTRQAKIRAS